MEKDESHAESSDAVEEMYCELCKTKGRSRVADGFCVDCVKYFCSNCLESHSDFLPTHLLKDKNSMPQDVCVKPCPNHADEIIKFYCFQCVKFFCSLCKQKDHIACKTVSHLPKIVQGLDLKQQLNDVKKKLASNLKDVEKRESDVKLQSSVPSECATKAKAALQSKKMSVIQWLDKHVDNIEKVIDEIQSSDEKALDSEGSALAVLKDIASSVKTDMDCKQLPTNQCELFMAVKKIQRQQKDIEEKLMQAGQHRVTSYEFKPSTYLEKLLGDGILGELAKKGTKRKKRRLSIVFRISEGLRDKYKALGFGAKMFHGISLLRSRATRKKAKNSYLSTWNASVTHRRGENFGRAMPKLKFGLSSEMAKVIFADNFSIVSAETKIV